MGQSCILLLEQKWRNPPKPIPPLACMRHPAQNSQSWPRLFIIDLMASTWKRDNQGLFPVKQSCCFSSPHRKTQHQHASCFSYSVTFGFLGEEKKHLPVMRLLVCLAWGVVILNAHFVYVQIKDAMHFSKCVLSRTNLVVIHIWLFRWSNLLSRLLFCHCIWFLCASPFLFTIFSFEWQN